MNALQHSEVLYKKLKNNLRSDGPISRSEGRLTSFISMKNSNGLRQAESLKDLGAKHPFDFKVGYTRQKMPPIPSHPSKALVITVYRNGDPYYPGSRVTLRPGRDITNLSTLCDFLSQRLRIAVRFLFAVDGTQVTDLENIKDGAPYVVSATRYFQEAPYGRLERLRTSVRQIAPQPEVAKLSRSSSADKLKTSVVVNVAKHSLPGSRESCVVTVVNRKDPARRSRVLLNLKTRQSWEEVIRDMGQAVRLRKAAKMLTPWGEEVRSFSHLRNDLSDVETFYLDEDKTSPLQRANSDPQLNGRSLRVRIPGDFQHQR